MRMALLDDVATARWGREVEVAHHVFVKQEARLYGALIRADIRDILLGVIGILWKSLILGSHGCNALRRLGATVGEPSQPESISHPMASPVTARALGDLNWGAMLCERNKSGVPLEKRQCCYLVPLAIVGALVHGDPVDSALAVVDPDWHLSWGERS
jgi:hypothetical protein